LPLDSLQKLNINDETFIKNAYIILILGVLSIIITSPLGAVLIDRLGRIWLNKGISAEIEESIELNEISTSEKSNEQISGIYERMMNQPNDQI
jgi:hypothetical protein